MTYPLQPRECRTTLTLLQENVNDEYSVVEEVLRIEEEREEEERLLAWPPGYEEESGTEEEEVVEVEGEQEEVKEVTASMDINENVPAVAESDLMDMESPSYEGDAMSILNAEKTVCPTAASVKVDSASYEGTNTLAESPEDAGAVEKGGGRGSAAARPPAPPVASFQSTDVRNRAIDSTLAASNHERSLRGHLVALADRGHVSNYTLGQLQRAGYMSPACNERGVIVRYRGPLGGGGRLTLGRGADLPFSAKATRPSPWAVKSQLSGIAKTIDSAGRPAPWWPPRGPPRLRAPRRSLKAQRPAPIRFQKSQKQPQKSRP